LPLRDSQPVERVLPRAARPCGPDQSTRIDSPRPGRGTAPRADLRPHAPKPGTGTPSPRACRRTTSWWSRVMS